MRCLKYLSHFLLILSLWSCNTSEEKKQDTAEINKAESEFVYSIDTSSVSIVWTGYKFTSKLGVSGTFNDYTIITKTKSGTIEAILNDLQLTIPTLSVDTKNPIRDFKLNTYFFKAFNTPLLQGTITHANPKVKEGSLKLKMNQKSRKIPYTYAHQNDTIVLFTHLDLNLWNAVDALNMLNKECYELHKGADGISKLWPDVDVSIKLPLKKESPIH